MIPLLVGLGVTELSVGAARVAETHAACARSTPARPQNSPARPSRRVDAAEVERLLAEAGHELGERGDGA